MNLEQNLITLKPREESGSKTARKYTFQKDLSLFLLLGMHEQRQDYVFLFDFHDDLVIVDSSINPQKLDFFQIKTKDSGNWTINSLIKTEKDKLSILGKLYLNKLNFVENTNSLNFISNANYSFSTLNNGEESQKKTQIKATELNNKSLQEIIASIRKEHNLDVDPELKNITEFHVTKLSNEDSSTHCLGELNKLLNKINPDNKINPELAYKQIINEVKIKTENTFGDKSISNFHELINVKGITKKQFLDFLEKAGLYKSVEQEWEDIKTSLDKSDLGYMEMIKYKKSWRDLSIALIKDSNNIPLQQLKDEIKSILKVGISEGNIKPTDTLLKIINHCFGRINRSLYDEYFIKCLIIHSIHEI